MTQDLQRILDGGVRQVLSDALAARPYSHCQFVSETVAAVVTCEDDIRFLPDTLAAVLEQTVLPGVIVVADCSGQTMHPMETSFDVVTASSEPLEYVPQAQTVSVQVVNARGARSFGDAVQRAIGKARLGDEVKSLWLLHDDSRPANANCLEVLLEAQRNTPGASLLGAKQLDWEGENLHDVGAYASKHGIVSLVVDGEPDQEQYDSRADVFSVSLAGALLPLITLRSMGGINGWFTTYAESVDFCRRVSRSGGRVLVVPQARIAHRRARYEGVRTRNGEEVDEELPVNPSMSVLVAEQRYQYTDIARLRWPIIWIFSLFAAFFKTLARLVSKQPYEAWCELCMPWHALTSVSAGIQARSNVARQSKVPHAQLNMITATRAQLAQWRDRKRALDGQRNVTLLSPLVRSHLRVRAVKRWSAALAMAAVAFIAVAAMYWPVLRSLFSGGSLCSNQLLPTGATFGQLAEAASTQWVWNIGGGVSMPPAPWLWVLLATSLFTLGNVAAATGLLFFLAAPLSALSFWALAGIFTRSDTVRIASGLLWCAFGLAMGLYATANLPMLTVMIFLPAAFAFVFRAVGLYHTEDQVRPRASVQAAAAASLCFMPVIAAEPQLLLPLIVTFLVFLLFIPRHRAMLLLMPIPAALLCAPTLVHAARLARHGAWRQIFGDMNVPSIDVNGAPDSLNLSGVVDRAFGIDIYNPLDDLMDGGYSMGILVALIVALVLAIVSLMLPFALRTSRMMWVVMLTGGALAVVSAHVAIAFDTTGAVAGSVLPGLTLAMLGLMSCVCLMAGGAVRKFKALRVSKSAAKQVQTREGRKAIVLHRFVVVGRLLLVLILAASIVVWSGFAFERNGKGQVTVSGDGMPMVATDAVQTDHNQRVLALYADSRTDVSYSIMRTSRGDLIDSSPAWRAAVASGSHDDTDNKIGELAARLLSNSDSDALASLAKLGFGGVFVVYGGSGSEQLATNLTASEGTQTVVSNQNGTYYRLTAADGKGMTVKLSEQDAATHNMWRISWLVVLAVVFLLYVLVAIPRKRDQQPQEEA
ncbi:glycosyltransferase family 2 protein [Bifidobacterium sp. 64T4]|uniref:glycosyltransferase family 2 protein n=1 Tax=Bifidobacterium pongonis TaxID=2834432 RepID=UPI001C589ECD|nr:glycosyltransferase family 2 protein [Bifidobacterium pongonis]MBW3095204.1 glycosyltransferase family 2 protein [Bifidobacterium pongonis]